MVQNFDTSSNYTGDGSLSTYSFDFFIVDKQDLRIVILNTLGEIVTDVRGDDTSVLSGVTITNSFFQNGGSIELDSALPIGYELWVIMDPLEPVQDTRFRDQQNFSLTVLERTFDYILTCVQRAFVMSRKSIKLPDWISTDDFDPTLPADIVGSIGKALITNSTGDGVEMGPTADEISNAQGYASDAAVSAAEALTSANNADASEAAAAASAVAAAASAALLAKVIVGLANAPINIIAANGVPFTSTAWETLIYLQGNGASVVVSAAARIAAGSFEGQRLTLRGTNNAQYVDLEDGNGIETGGTTVRLGQHSTAVFEWDSINLVWVLVSYNQIIP